MTPLKLKGVLLEAIKYPPFAQAEFFRKKQRESGWSRDVYFEALSLELDNLYVTLEREKQQKRGKLKEGEISEDKITPGKGRPNLDPMVLKDLYVAVDDAFQLYQASGSDSAEQIISLLEASLIYIEDKFSAMAEQKQDGKSESMKLSKEDLEEADPASLLPYKDRYPTLFFDFNVVKNAIRHLLLFSPHPDTLKVILQPFYERCKRIVELWNTKVYWGATDSVSELFTQLFIAHGLSYHPYVHRNHIKKMRFDTDALKYARFAHQVGDVIRREVEGDKIKLPEMKKPPTKLTYLLKLYYEKGCKPLLQQQAVALAKKTNFSEKKMVERWRDLDNDGYVHNEEPNNIKEFREAYEILLEVFKDSNPQAHTDVKNHYDQLIENYQKKGSKKKHPRVP